MSSKQINWESPLKELVSGKKSKTVDKLIQAGFVSLQDLLWIFPLNVHRIPVTTPFSLLQEGSYFKGVGKVIASRDQANFKAKGKGRTPLTNVTLTIQDRFSQGVVSLKWFNLYPSQVKDLKEHKHIFFTGQGSSYMGQQQILNAEVIDISPEDYEKPLEYWQQNQEESLRVSYPTIEGISPSHLGGLIKKIPEELWQDISDPLPQEMRDNRNLLDLGNAFNILHGRVSPEQYNEQNKQAATQRVIYDEFFQEQVKIQLRKERNQKIEAIQIQDNQWREFTSLFPYTLTEDQDRAIEEIMVDLKTGHPMMRLIQGDVGSGKTSVALISSLVFIKNGFQAAILCPTESLAFQHFLTFKALLKDTISVDLLTGSQTKKEKEAIYQELKDGKISLVVGTHALIQDKVEFQNLGLSIIDEQHKFGVEQRIKLLNKGKGSHCLLLTATPIPRSLSLTQYGDLEISVIKSMPSNRKGTQTRIVNPETYQKYLSFVKTRLSMKEQVYVVVPAIEDNPEQDMLNLEVVLKRFKEYFPEFNVVGLHGKMKSEEKNQALMDFREKKIDLLVSTSVIEVGINNPNATIMTILNPERFGLSSLHQMRGRVGRGDKPGFCFLVNDKVISPHSMERLRVIESSTDGFKIAEEDLRIRGEGDLFGREQSGVKSTRVLASLIEHQETLENAKEDLSSIMAEQPQIFETYAKKLGQNELLYKTV
ncbi:MAG: ATP-dependent DNA helicase RecG [Halobacteriovoraceae bacterium]|nr:ATP-dependent DNA helicase RecG [Halobacteriovoraceae bacterium]